jgi:hypothetical protein
MLTSHCLLLLLCCCCAALQEIWRMRGEYWYRKITTYPDVINQARVSSSPARRCSVQSPDQHQCALLTLCLAVFSPMQGEAVELWQTKISQPGTWTWGDLMAAGVVGVQCVGAFAIGEVLGRGSLIGYKTGSDHGH